MPLQKDTVAIPLLTGADLNTEARLLDPPKLLEATNIRFNGGATRKRRGHTQVKLRNEKPLPTNTQRIGWLFGYGRIYHDRDITVDFPYYISSTKADTLFDTSEHPDSDVCYGTATRDYETLMWNGHSLLSYAPSQQEGIAGEIEGSAVMPSLHATPIAKTQQAQNLPDGCDNGVCRLVTWLDEDGALKFSFYDSVTGAPLVVNQALDITDPNYARVFHLEDHFFIVSCDTGNDTLYLFRIEDIRFDTVEKISLGSCAGHHFDVFQISETRAAICKNDDPDILVYVIDKTGNPNSVPDFHTITFTPTTPGFTLVSVAQVYGYNNAYPNFGEPTSHFGITYFVPGTGIGLSYWLNSTTGAIRSDSGETFLPNSDDAIRMSLSSRYLRRAGAAIWDAFWDNGTEMYARRWWAEAFTPTLGTQRYRAHLGLASRGFRMGDRTFIWAGHYSTLQSTWFLLDEALLPVGRLDWGVANVLPTADVTGFVASIMSHTEPEMVHLALGYKQRVLPSGETDVLNGIFTESSIKFIELDFTPFLRSAKAGRGTYFPGAQVWSYDGQELVEAGFHIGPELAAPAVSSGGALTADGTYSYRVDLCYRNAQNEEVRSLSILTTGAVTTSTNKTVTLQIPTCLTRRANSYFLVYRNAMEDGVPLVNWWLLNSRDPNDASFLPNDLTTDYVTLVDAGTVSDTAIQTRELHPATDTYLQPTSPPACEILASGHDRVWCGGGELLPGQVAPSRLFNPGEQPTWNPYLTIQVDRSAEPLTAIGFVGEVVVFFRRHSTYILDSDGPDNIAQGGWNSPRLSVAELGAVSQEGLGLISAGLAFQSPAGFRLLGPGGALESASIRQSPLGVPVDSVARDFLVRSCVVVDQDQEIRWYGEDSTIVYSYLYDSWAVWTCGGVGATRAPGGLALLAREDGYLLVETEGVWKDGDKRYSHRVRLPWLHGGQLGDFQRVREVGGIGRYADLDDPEHKVKVEFYYDNREFWEERIEWSMPDSESSNIDTFGSETFGAGVFGDDLATAQNLSDATWDWVRRPNRQKCTAISIAIDDNNTDGPGFILAGVSLSLARKPGLNRVPWRGGTITSRGQ